MVAKLCNDWIYVLFIVCDFFTFYFFHKLRWNRFVFHDPNTAAALERLARIRFHVKNRRAIMILTWRRTAGKKHKSHKLMLTTCSEHFKRSCKINNDLPLKLKFPFLIQLALRSNYSQLINNISVNFGQTFNSRSFITLSLTLYDS